jgi:hypothetical protein
VDEPVERRAGGRVSSEESVAIREQVGKFAESLAEVFGSVVVVVEMNLYLAKTRTAEGCESIEVVLLVLFGREEKRVSRRPAVAVAEIPEQAWVLTNPRLDPMPRYFARDIVPFWFKMIGHTKEQMHWTA